MAHGSLLPARPDTASKLWFPVVEVGVSGGGGSTLHRNASECRRLTNRKAGGKQHAGSRK